MLAAAVFLGVVVGWRSCAKLRTCKSGKKSRVVQLRSVGRFGRFKRGSQAGAGALNVLAWMAQERVLFLPVLSFFLSFLEEEMGYVCQTQKSNVCSAHAHAGGGWNRALGEGCENSHLLMLRHSYEMA